VATAGGTDPRPLLAQRDLFGALADHSTLADEIEVALRALENGALEAAAGTVSGPPAHVGSAA
jgi:hypothetical protein